MIAIALAFASGILTIVSPCTLPLVPVVLGSRADPYRWTRVAATVIGLGATFVVATVAIASLLAGVGVSLASARVFAAVVLGVAGLSLALPGLERWVERRLSPLAALGDGRLRAVDRGGRPSRARSALRGALVGSLLGLVWAPCVGPLMAGVIATATIEGPTLGGLSVALAYVAGTSAALVLVAAAVGRLRVRLPGKAPAAVAARRATGIAMALVAVLVVSGLDTRIGITLQPDALVTSATKGAGNNVTQSDDLGPAPELAGITAWINTGPTTLAAHRGEVVLVHFWTFGCSNCQNVQPYVKDWYARYRDRGFTVLAVHTPELSFERDLDNVRAAVAAKGVAYPVAVDPDFATWRAYGNHYWPAFYFVDRGGHVRRVHFGEGDYAASEAVIEQLLAEPA